MSLLPVDEALQRILGGIAGPLPAETVALEDAIGRTLAAPVIAHRAQPPFAASAMDGYAVRAADLATPPFRLRVVGESIAGRRFAGVVGAGEAVRIFTGAPLPDGADTIIVQENTHDDGAGGVAVTALSDPARRFIRRAGLDFSAGQTLLEPGTRLDSRHIALAAAANHAHLSVHTRPRVALLATGDELVMPGEDPGPDQIVASSLFSVAALLREAGAEPIPCGIARDSRADLDAALAAARAARPDILVTLGGASVGDHDLVRGALQDAGMTLDFWRIAMRPGKPLIHGRLGDILFVGLPGNPVSSIVCAVLFLVPALRKLSGDRRPGPMTVRARLAGDLPPNDSRQDYLRARVERGADGIPCVHAFTVQDSSMLRTFAQADALIVRRPHAPAARAGDLVDIVALNPAC